ncbi:uracil-DNA glycosylase [Acidicapsa acidisoli]|uniref:uracil-DNA glycosylase n=1 Tax=Acidicapsa acidisoli TaxID=1615681 RepID=UPI0021DF8B6A|nr:uracil-DNA glycosylase family protein [Acidicapsa acidisoli]
MTPPSNPINLNDPATRDALHARLRFYRDLGIGEFYRREVDSALWAQPNPQSEPQPAPAQTQATPPAPPEQLFPQLNQEIDIAPRKPFPAAPAQAEPVPPEQHFAALKLIREEIGDCTRCALAKGRNKLVFGDGDPNAKLMFVGEGPGADEDASGLPFVGRGGQLLNNMIGAMGLKREEVYIANVVKCRPPNNRTPEPDEAHTCSPFLFRQIDVVRPKVIVALGQTAVTYLTGEKRPLSAWRGTVHPFRVGAKLIVTYHPAFLLRDPNQKKHAWADLQIAMRELGLTSPARK